MLQQHIYFCFLWETSASFAQASDSHCPGQCKQCFSSMHDLYKLRHWADECHTCGPLFVMKTDFRDGLLVVVVVVVGVVVVVVGSSWSSWWASDVVVVVVSLRPEEQPQPHASWKSNAWMSTMYMKKSNHMSVAPNSMAALIVVEVVVARLIADEVGVTSPEPKRCNACLEPGRRSEHITHNSSSAKMWPLP